MLIPSCNHGLRHVECTRAGVSNWQATLIPAPAPQGKKVKRHDMSPDAIELDTRVVELEEKDKFSLKLD